MSASPSHYSPAPLPWERRLRQVLAGRTRGIAPRMLLLLGAAFAVAYGAVMGSHTGLWDGRPLQVLYSAVKVPLLLGVSFAIARLRRKRR